VPLVGANGSVSTASSEASGMPSVESNELHLIVVEDEKRTRVFGAVDHPREVTNAVGACVLALGDFHMVTLDRQLDM